MEGLYEKYKVTRTDGKSEPGERHYLCNYFVLDLKHDIHARKAIMAYAESCRKLKPELSNELFRIADEMLEVG